jgi:hypothetical protein
LQPCENLNGVSWIFMTRAPPSIETRGVRR